MTHTAAPLDKLLPCDLVMKGGLTSGVIYPALIQELAKKYSFKGIGGTSAGAIAAGACAAAEYGRKYGGGPGSGGFDTLGKLPALLGASKPGEPTMLLQLFQPSQALKRHFDLLIGVLNDPSITAAARLLVRKFSLPALLGLLVPWVMFAPVVMLVAPGWSAWGAFGIALVVLALWAGVASALAASKRPGRTLMLLAWLFGLVATMGALKLLVGYPFGLRLGLAALVGSIAGPLWIALALALAGIRFVQTLLTGLHENFYGICGGLDASSCEGSQALTCWLTKYLDELAGLPEGQLLTFGHLWTGSNSNSASHEQVHVAKDPSIDLQVMTTAISQQTCYSLPFRSGAGYFYYDPTEWGRLFPKHVMKWLQDASTQAEVRRAELPEHGRPGAKVQRVVGSREQELRMLPANSHLPVIVALRMSLSFPLLLSAVPLYAIDFSLKRNHRSEDSTNFAHLATKIWFSDGGLSSNMPLHFFDAPLPGHPTFAVNLKEPHPDYPVKKGVPACEQEGRVYLPKRPEDGRQRYWVEPKDASPAGGLFYFVRSIITTMQNWRDEIMFPYPGYRDRIAQVSELPDEGGVHLTMPQDVITALSDAGRCAALQFIDEFHPQGKEAGKGWDHHQSVRLRSLLGNLERLATSMEPKLQTGPWYALAEALSGMQRYGAKDPELAKDYLEQLATLGTRLRAADSRLDRAAPRPKPRLRTSPRI